MNATMTEPILCACGCGEPAPLITKTDTAKGRIKGQYAKYVANHYGKMMMSQRETTAVQQWTDPAMKEITEADIVNLRTVDEIQAADIFDARVRYLERYTRRSFVEVGMICQEVEKRDLWRRMVVPGTSVYFHSFGAWMVSSLNVSRSSAYSAMNIVKGGVSIEDLREMPRCNAETLASLSTKVQKDPKVIEMAKSATSKDFIKAVQQAHPDQHVESKRAIVAKPTESARSLMEHCFDVVKWAYDIESREDVMENLVAYFMDGACEREGFDNWTNREAYEAVQKRSVAS